MSTKPAKAPPQEKWLYGTFDAECPSGWMLELNRYLGDFQLLVWIYVICAIVLSLIWPVSWIIGLGIGAYAQSKKRPDLYNWSFQCIFATAMGLALCTVPYIVMHSMPGGVKEVDALIERRELLSNDVQSSWKAQMFLMLLYYFCLMYQDVNEQLVEVKNLMVPYLKKQVISLDMPSEQRTRIEAYLKENELDDEGDLLNLLKVLEVMPGWESSGEDDVEGDAKGFFSVIHGKRESAHAKGLFGLDIYTLHQLKYNLHKDVEQSAGESAVEEKGMMDAFAEEAEASKIKCARTCSFVLGYLKSHPITLAMVIVLSIIRILIPRLWLKYYLGGMLLPVGFLPSFFVFTAVVTIFVCYALFMSLFLVMVFEYESNAHQLILLTALINMDARCQYSELVLVKSMGLAPEESETFMSRLPLLNLCKSRNAIGFWGLRDYVMLDRSNDRVGMQIMISISILLIVFNLCLAAYDLWTLPWISAFVPIVLYDLVVIGVMILYSLQQALYMNSWMASHVQHFNRAIHDVMNAYADAMLEGGAVLEAEKKNKILVQDLTLAKKYLRSAVTMVRENDPREALLFGAEITPASIASSAGGFLATVTFMLYKMLQKGTNPMDAAKGAEAAKFLVQSAMKKFL